MPPSPSVVASRVCSSLDFRSSLFCSLKRVFYGDAAVLREYQDKQETQQEYNTPSASYSFTHDGISSHLGAFLSLPLFVPSFFYEIPKRMGPALPEAARQTFLSSQLSSPLVQNSSSAHHFTMDFHVKLSFEWPFIFPVLSASSALLALALFLFAFLLYWRIFLCGAPKVIFSRSKGLSPALKEIFAQKEFLNILKRPYCPTPFLWSGHLQTIFTARGGAFLGTPKVSYYRENFPVFATGPGFFDGSVALDWAVTPSPKVSYNDQTPTIIIMHGLTGGSMEHYVKYVVNTFITKLGVRCVVLNQRGCGGQALQSPQAYCGAYTGDTRQAIQHIRARLPASPLFALAFSLGANLLLKCIGEDGQACPLSGVISLANPYDLLSSSKTLESTWFKRNAYSRTLAQNLRSLFRLHVDSFRTDARVDFEKVLKAKLMRKFDAELTAKCFNYESVDNYYRDASCAPWIAKIRVPLLCLTALDDPICAADCLPLCEIESNPNVFALVTKCGGHSMDWFEGIFKPRGWAARVCTEFFRAAIKGIEKERSKSNRKVKFPRAVAISHPPPMNGSAAGAVLLSPCRVAARENSHNHSHAHGHSHDSHNHPHTPPSQGSQESGDSTAALASPSFTASCNDSHMENISRLVDQLRGQSGISSSDLDSLHSSFVAPAEAEELEEGEIRPEEGDSISTTTQFFTKHKREQDEEETPAADSGSSFSEASSGSLSAAALSELAKQELLSEQLSQVMNAVSSWQVQPPQHFYEDSPFPIEEPISEAEQILMEAQFDAMIQAIAKTREALQGK